MIPQEDITAVVHLSIRGRTATVVSTGHTYCSFKLSYMEKNCDSKTTVTVVSPFYTVVVHQLGFTEKNCKTAEHSLYSSFT